MIQAGHASTWLDLLAELPDSVRQVGRIRLLEAQAALSVGDTKSLQRFFDAPVVVPDIREGEISLSDLWFGYQEQRVSQAEQLPIDAALRARVHREFPPPADIDFRMAAEEHTMDD